MGEWSDGFHTSIHLFQTPCNALQIPFKIISFLLKKDGQKNNRDFIKGRRRGSPFYEVTSIFFFPPKENTGIVVSPLEMSNLMIFPTIHFYFIW